MSDDVEKLRADLELSETLRHGLQRDLQRTKEDHNRLQANLVNLESALLSAVTREQRRVDDFVKREQNLLEENSRLVDLRRAAEAQAASLQSIAHRYQQEFEKQRQLTIEVVKQRDTHLAELSDLRAELDRVLRDGGVEKAL